MNLATTANNVLYQFPIQIKPMGAVRMTQMSKYKDNNAKRYLSYKERIAWEAKKHIKQPIDEPISITLAFYYPIPQSWSKRKRDEANDQAILPTVKPDIDNCVKGVFDALNKVAWRDDALVVRQTSFKVYAYDPMIVITISRIGEGIA